MWVYTRCRRLIKLNRQSRKNVGMMNVEVLFMHFVYASVGNILMLLVGSNVTLHRGLVVLVLHNFQNP